MTSRPHPILLAILATFLGSFLSAFLLTLFGFTGEIEAIGQLFGGTIAVGGYGFLFAIPVVFLYGMPLYAILRKVKSANPVSAAFFGAAPGIADVLWTHDTWLNAILWHGTLISVIYWALRQRYATP